MRSSVGRLVAQDKAIRFLSGVCDADRGGKCKQHHDPPQEHEEHKEESHECWNEES